MTNNLTVVIRRMAANIHLGVYVNGPEIYLAGFVLSEAPLNIVLHIVPRISKCNILGLDRIDQKIDYLARIISRFLEYQI